MKCRHVREYLIAFLDSELDAQHSIEVQRHLDGCALCAREAEIERTIRKQLEHAIARDSQGIPHLMSSDRRPPRSAEGAVCFNGSEGAVQYIGPRKGAHTTHSHRLRLVATAAVVLLAVGAASLLWWNTRHTDHDGSFADMIVADFEKFIAKGKPLQVESSDRHLVSKWLRKETLLNVSLPLQHDPHCQLIGARKCRLDGRSAAFAAFEMQGMPASLIVCEDSPGVLAGMSEVRHDGRVHWVDKCKGLTVVACRRDKLLYVAVSRLPEKQLMCLMTEGAHESD